MPRRWSPQDVDAVRDMAQVQGLSAREIADRLGCSEAAVTGLCTRRKIRLGGVTRSTPRGNNGGGGSYGRQFYFTMWRGQI